MTGMEWALSAMLVGGLLGSVVAVIVGTRRGARGAGRRP